MMWLVVVKRPKSSRDRFSRIREYRVIVSEHVIHKLHTSPFSRFQIHIRFHTLQDTVPRIATGRQMARRSRE